MDQILENSTYNKSQKIMDDEPKDTHDFKPVGTIAFVILLLAFTALVWFSIYNLQLERHI